MTYGTILVEVTDDSGLEPRLRVARVLADRFDAALIGMHVMPPPFIPGSYGDATAYFGPDLIETQRRRTGRSRSESPESTAKPLPIIQS